MKICKYCCCDRSDSDAWSQAAGSCKSCYSALSYMRRSAKKCSIEGCTRKRNNLKYCYLHAKDPEAPAYRECEHCGNAVPTARHGKAACSDACTKELDAKRRLKVGCKIDGCKKRLASLGYCKMHLNRFKTWGDPHQTGPAIVCEMCGTSTFGVVSSQRLCNSPECLAQFAKLPESVRHPVDDLIRLARAERRRELRAMNLDRYREVDRLWRQNNPDKARENVRRRRARQKRLDVREVTDRDIRRMRHRQRGECFHCGGDMRTLGEELDHVIPQFHQGRHSIGNLVLSCPDCNHSKNEWFLFEWRMRRERGRPLRTRKSRYTNVESIAPPTDAATSNVVQLVGDK